MKVVLSDDLVVGTVNGDVDGVAVPDNLADLATERLRFDGSNIIDIAGINSFYVDDFGRKHIAQTNPAWQALVCGWDDPLVLDAGSWRIRADSDVLAWAKTEGKLAVANRAEIARQAYITPGDGKAAIYALKRAEAQAWQAEIDASQTPDAADYPWLNARATRLGVTVQTVADEWNTKAAAWEAVGRTIEDTYEGAIDAIDALADAATVVANIEAIIDGLTWP